MIYIASDHAGYYAKEGIKEYLAKYGYEVSDIGALAYTKGDDYPDYAHELCKKIGDGDIGILLCDTGIGMSIVANRYRHIRAALCSGIFDAMRSREHNNANVLVMGAETNEQEDLEVMTKVFLETEFSEEDRHVRRVDKMNTL